MVGMWFKRAFEGITEETLNAYEWAKGQWNARPGTYPGQMDQVIFNQQFRGNNVQVESGFTPEPEPSIQQGFVKYKAYMVWYSWPTYETRREVAITFWMPRGEYSNTNVQAWLDKAIRAAFGKIHGDSGIGVGRVEQWGHHESHYRVGEALESGFTQDISDYEFNKIEYEYTKDDDQLDGGVLFK